MELIDIRFFTIERRADSTTRQWDKSSILLRVTRVLTKPSLTVHCVGGTGRKRNYVMNEQHRSCFLRSCWLD